MKKIKTEHAVGKILGADVTEVVPGVRKGPLFKRGHIIEASDVDKLLSIGKHYVWVFEEQEGFIHEDDAGKKMMEALKGDNLTLSPPSESKVKLFATADGIVHLNLTGLKEINNLETPRVACKRNFSFVRKDTPVALGKVMPVEIPIKEMQKIIEVANHYKPIVEVLSIKPHNIALFPVGSEFIEGRRKETMSFRIEEYFDEMGQSVILRRLLPDDENKIAKEGLAAMEVGADFLIFLGGMSVDPDDRTVFGIEKMGVKIEIYGVPMWPGTTFLIGYKDNKVILGIPSSAGFINSGTSFHRIMPILLAGYRLSRDEILDMANGGFIDATNL